MKLSTMMKKALVVVMALAMTLGVCAPSILAANEPTTTQSAETKNDEIINYVSIGDSMTNGYGLPGYDAEAGVYDYGYESYANKFAAYLAGADFEAWAEGGYEGGGIVFEGEKGTVHHAQLGLSAARPEDINFLLRLDYDDEAVSALIDKYPTDDKVYYRCSNHSGVSYEDIVYCHGCKWDHVELPGYDTHVDDYPAWWSLVHGDNWENTIGYGDFWTWKELAEDYRFGTVATYIKYNFGTEAERARAEELMASRPAKPRDDASNGAETCYVAKHYQDAVKEADVISIALGNGNFGVWLMGRITAAIMEHDGVGRNGVYDVEKVLAICTPEQREVIEAILVEAEPMIDYYIDDMMGELDENRRESVKNVCTYGVVSFVVNYQGVIERILELNPDVEIVLTGLMNTYAGDDELAEDGVITIGNILDAIFPLLNTYIAALPAAMQNSGNELYEDANIYYAEEYAIECLIHNFGDESFLSWEGVARDRFVSGIVGECDCGKNCTDVRACTDFDSGLFWGMLEGMTMQGVTVVRISRGEIAEYYEMTDAERAAFAAENKDLAASIGIYLALEDAICESGKRAPVTLTTLTALSLDASLLGPALTNFNALLPDDILAYTDVAVEYITSAVNAQLKSAGVTDFSFKNEDVKTIAALEEKDARAAAVKACALESGVTLPDAVAAELAGVIKSANINDIGMVLTLPETLSEALWTDSDLCSMLAVVARNKLGNGLGAHPSTDGHGALADAMRESYENGWTVQKQTVKNAYELVREYGDEICEYAPAIAAEKIKEAYATLVDHIISEMTEYGEEVADELAEWLYSRPDVIAAYFEENGEALVREYAEKLVSFAKEQVKEHFSVKIDWTSIIEGAMGAVEDSVSSQISSDPEGDSSVKGDVADVGAISGRLDPVKLSMRHNADAIRSGMAGAEARCGSAERCLIIK